MLTNSIKALPQPGCILGLVPKVPSEASTNRRRAQRVGPSLPDPPPAALLSIQPVVEIRSGED